MITNVEMYRARLRAAHEQLMHATWHHRDRLSPHHPLNEALCSIICALHLTERDVTTASGHQSQDLASPSTPDAGAPPGVRT